MSCNSTYLLDGRTDDGAKADELATVLDELFERPDSKVVVFSQWLRTHELLIRRLQKKRWGYVLFHGGVPSAKRAALVDRFREDPRCRVFLATDAGGVGLNLQHSAAAIVNMDLPWNPAVLEQRIGRVHRLGQTRSVQVVNFVAEGTIEERMLSLLAFKQSLFAGVLDGGESEVFLGGTRLAKFMQSVAAVTEAAHEPESADAEAAFTKSAKLVAAAASADRAAVARPAERPAIDDAQAQKGTTGTAQSPWAPLLSAGLELAKVLAAAARSDGNRSDPATVAGALLETDARTGRSYLRLPMPEPHVVQQLGDALCSLVNSLARNSADAAQGMRE